MQLHYLTQQASLFSIDSIDVNEWEWDRYKKCCENENYIKLTIVWIVLMHCKSSAFDLTISYRCDFTHYHTMLRQCNINMSNLINRSIQLEDIGKGNSISAAKRE